MTGITKDELMQMARKAGFHSPKGGGELFSPYLEHMPMNDVVGRFYNAILERAAAECEATKTRYKDMAEEEDKTILKAGECSDYWSHVSALAGAAYDIRALKINTGD